MKLSQYKEKKKSKKIIIVFVAIIFLIGGVAIGITFANFKVQKSFKIMEGNFIYEGSGDVIFAFYKGDELLTQMPEKDNLDNITFVKGECNKGAIVEWDEDTWAPKILNLHETKTTCKLYFDRVYESMCNSSNEQSAICYLVKKAESNKTNMRYDNTKDNNLRFISRAPNNYVKFNNETWRIIGVMNNVEDEFGNTGSHLKIIRNSIGSFSWDSSEYKVNNGGGVNEWSTSAMAKVLNENYYNKEAGGICYNSSENRTVACPNWQSIGLDDTARKMISKVKWNLGTISKGFNLAYSNTLITPPYMYEAERSENTGKICKKNTSYCSDEKERTTLWPGYVGLMYPSDYGYATSGGGIIKRQDCLSLSMNQWESSLFQTSCGQSNWLYDSNNEQWTITSTPNTTFATQVFKINKNWTVLECGVAQALAIRPVVYLNSNVKIEEDTNANYGYESAPYRLTT